MILSIWRFAHLALAIVSSIFLVMASVTGAILAIDAIQEKMPAYRVANFEQITLAQAVPALKKQYAEITEVDVNHNGFVTLKGFDNDGNEIQGYVDAKTGAFLAKPIEKSEFIQWVTAFHRSMFLKDPGRLIIGVVSFLLFLISISGLALIIQRQRSLKGFFSKIVREYFSQYYHIISGRIMLIPILVIALTGTYLSMVRFQLFDNQVEKPTKVKSNTNLPNTSIENFASFKQIKLADVSKIEFPFADDPEEFFNVKLNDRALVIDQFTGQVLSEVKYPKTLLLENLSLDLHTGRTSIIWAVVLGIACINILFFICSGFTITLRRKGTRVKNKHKIEDAEFVLLVGSENGSTLQFANAIHQQLLAQNKLSYLGSLNQYAVFEKAKHLVIFTSTYGIGDPPNSGKNFINLLEKYPQMQNIKTSVVGFGSKSYPDFCEFAKQVNLNLKKRNWSQALVPLHTVDDKSANQFTTWVKEWSAAANVNLATTPAIYAEKPKNLKKAMVLDRSFVSDTDHTFTLTLALPGRNNYQSGDLLAIYPANDNRERLYSVAKVNGNIHLVIRLHENGLGSTYLNNLKVGDTLAIRMVANEAFHKPINRNVAMIANGTGIAPFLGMVETNSKKTNVRLYAGFRHETASILKHCQLLSNAKSKGKLQAFEVAYSREQNCCYVMDLIKKDSAYFAELLANNGVVMICGALKMQLDVEEALNDICLTRNKQSLVYYKENGQLLADCY